MFDGVIDVPLVATSGDDESTSRSIVAPEGDPHQTFPIELMRMEIRKVKEVFNAHLIPSDLNTGGRVCFYGYDVSIDWLIDYPNKHWEGIEKYDDAAKFGAAMHLLRAHSGIKRLAYELSKTLRLPQAQSQYQRAICRILNTTEDATEVDPPDLEAFREANAYKRGIYRFLIVCGRNIRIVTIPSILIASLFGPPCCSLLSFPASSDTSRHDHDTERFSDGLDRVQDLQGVTVESSPLWATKH
ncbi:hypothetical protein BYT27DRAFT_7258162 [Phlegmacium glaucopus]|nr:hypothetical protein BYT27DRAFT_7258162 [Phlegmacium glaucopus]